MAIICEAKPEKRAIVAIVAVRSGLVVPLISSAAALIIPSTHTQGKPPIPDLQPANHPYLEVLGMIVRYVLLSTGEGCPAHLVPRVTE
jgi:hypothetical protein